jgi:hypothetical protein
MIDGTEIFWHFFGPSMARTDLDGLQGMWFLQVMSARRLWAQHSAGFSISTDFVKPSPWATNGGLTMERTDLLKRLSDREVEHWQSRGLSPVKAKQLATEKLKEWKALTGEELEKILTEQEFGY